MGRRSRGGGDDRGVGCLVVSPTRNAAVMPRSLVGRGILLPSPRSCVSRTRPLEFHNMATVRVLLFASYAEALGASSLDVELGPSARVRDVLASVRDRAGADRLPPSPLVAVNRAVRDARRSHQRARRSGDHSAGGRGLDARRARAGDRSTSRRCWTRCATTPAGRRTLFLGTVRDVNDGRSVDGIDYSAYEGMARRELETIAREAVERFGTPHVVVVHRIGSLALDRGEHRDRRLACAAFAGDGCRAIRDRGSEEARADLEARALRRRDAGVGRSHARPCRGELADDRRACAARPVRPGHRVPAHLGHRPVQFPLPVLHAARRAAVAARRRTS